MPLVICPIHGRAGGALASHALDKRIREHTPWSREYSAHCISLLYEDIEYRGYMLHTDISEILQLGAKHEGGERYRFTDEEAMETAIGMFTAACTHCLHEWVKRQSPC